MKRITGTYVDPTANGVGKPGFTNGVPGVSGATHVNADFLNHVQEEIAAAVEAQGITLDDADKNQLASAIFGTEISPPEITASQDDWSPTGLSSADLVRVSTDDENNKLNSLDASAGRKRKFFVNVGSQPFPFVHEGSGTAENRFACPEGKDLVLDTGELAAVIYDVTSTRWRVFGLGRKGEVSLKKVLAGAADVATFLTITGATGGDRLVMEGGSMRLDAGGVQASGYFTSPQGFRYHATTPPTRGSFIHLKDWLKNANDPADAWEFAESSGILWRTSSAVLPARQGLIGFIELPDGAVLSSVFALVSQLSPATNGIELTVWQSLIDRDAAGGYATPVDTQIGSTAVNGVSGGANQLLTVAPAVTINNADYVYYCRLRASDAGLGTDVLRWCRLNWTDPGPRNH